jgi:putative ABC transport system permease protein
MAWRDSRRNLSRLFLFVSSIILGIGALVAIYSLSNNLNRQIDEQAATLIGADLEFSTNKIPPPHIQKIVDSIGDQRSEERSFSSMVYFPKNGGSRLAQIRALGGAFPYYGSLESDPAGAGTSFRKGQGALVDKTLMLQFNIVPGDSIKIGNVTFLVSGTLLQAPGQTGIGASVAPPVYIPLHYLEQTGLSQKGSRINYKYYFKFDKPVDVEAMMKTLDPRLSAEGVYYDTIQSQKEDTARSFRDLTRFLSLVGFIALLLGCVGVASAIHIYVKEKVNTVAVLRCLGVKSSQAFLIFLIQILGVGLIGSVIGALLGTLIQQFLPAVLQSFLPIELESDLSWSAIGQGIGLGVIISLLFALLPLIFIRKISPLNTLRMSIQETSLSKDPLRWLVYGLILLFVFGFAYLQLDGLMETTFFTAGLFVAFLVLTGIAAMLTWMVRKFFPTSWSYLWRQGLANLYRPNNQTMVLIVSIGLGTALICTLFFVQGILLNRVTLASSGNQPNMVLFDIQQQQREGVMQLARQQGLGVNGTVPIVGMRLQSINGTTIEQVQNNPASQHSSRMFSREYRVTFRDTIISSEKITEGEWTGQAKQGGIVPISMEQNYARRNELGLGDTLVFNVQGSLVPTMITSLREVDWNRIQTNFIIVFPTGVLEKAPQFHVLLTHVPSPEASAKFQQAIVRQYPNVSIIDLGLVLSILDDILGQIGFVIRFMAAFSIITGLVVLIASVFISKYQRMQETVLLRTLGASGSQIFSITALEYFFLGAFAAATGILLALAGSWALARYTFETSFTPDVWPIIIVFLVICLLTVMIGLFNSRSALTRPPLEILRQEV